jgi:predicted AAA+ superfamily ATPase
VGVLVIGLIPDWVVGVKENNKLLMLGCRVGLTAWLKQFANHDFRIITFRGSSAKPDLDVFILQSASKIDNNKLSTYYCHMYVQRDITKRLSENRSSVQLLTGPRQCGKSTLLLRLDDNVFQEVTFDDLQLRTLANRDPGLFLTQFQPPILLDEVQYVPPLFSEIKRYVDQRKRQRLEDKQPLSTLFRMTGSNQLLMDKNIHESLAGRASYFHLNTLSVHEIISALPTTNLSDILFKGGWPELYIDDQHLSPVQYLNDYIRSYIEKDIVLSAGVQKQEAFNIVLGLLAARTGMLLDYTNIARDSGIQSVTIKEWISILQRNALVYCLKPYTSNLNKRLAKAPKLYFLDTGLAVRLQGWREQKPLLTSPQAGTLFETLVFAEIIKFIQNYGKDWQVYLWRTREGEEIDFLIITPSGRVVALDAKMSIQSTQAIRIPPGLKKSFPQVKQINLVTFGGLAMQLTPACGTVPIFKLHDFLMTLE